ncbi:hypothetical protein POTOM_042496 [Populus tomentosa]|uniref:Uncharacterized protein n=1 Tax=Populus tomentosa TaxID=118781 RepID=A0A8X7YSH6_POPTO|nr:hypothetical protein POTOM_042496 [Populus tomentosa]
MFVPSTNFPADIFTRNAIERALAQERTDPETRRRGCLDHLMKDRTTLVIAHRLSTVQNPHQIALCSGGRIAELWTTQSEFLDKEGQFSSLALNDAIIAMSVLITSSYFLSPFRASVCINPILSIHHTSNAMIMPSVEDTDIFATLLMEHTVEPLVYHILYFSV